MVSGLYFIDSWAWIEYLKPRTAGEQVRRIIDGSDSLVTSTTVLAEVYYKILSEVSESDAEKAVEFMKRKAVIASLDEETAKAAARIKKNEKLSLADSFVLAAARKFNAVVLTGDPDFKRIPDVHYLGV